MAQSIYINASNLRHGFFPRATIITRNTLELRIPADGIPPYEIDSIIGKRFTRDVYPGELLRKEDYE
jgi:sialic acid synthase SpsE